MLEPTAMVQAKRPSRLPWLLWLLTLAAAAYAGWWGSQQLDSARSAQNSAADEAAAANKRASDARAEADKANEALAAVTKERDELLGKTSELSTTLAQKEQELARLTATYKSLEEKMAAEIKSGDVRLSQSEGRIQVDLVDKVLFDSGEAEVSPRGQEVLTRLGAILQGVEDRQIQISGHTDDSPITREDLKAKFATNWELSTARAVNVVRFLTEHAQVKPARLLAAGYGQYRPIASNVTPKGRAANRRIEILLLPPLEAKQAKLPQPAKDGGT